VHLIRGPCGQQGQGRRPDVLAKSEQEPFVSHGHAHEPFVQLRDLVALVPSEQEYLSLSGTASYAGDIDVLTAWQQISEDPKAVLVDVRTHAEWSYVGVPVLNHPDREVLLVEWLSYPDMVVHGDFADRLLQELEDRDVAADSAIYFLCRSGARSRHAAIDMTQRWSGPCFNIASGFEGDLDDALHRSSCNGWKHAGLPWRQF
jgi:rhodanese-related sulfurtransferase